MRPGLPPIATWALVGSCITTFLATLAGGGGLFLTSPEVLSEVGAVVAVRVWQGEIWRLVSGLFVHAAVWHLGLNLWVLWQVGRLLEPILGTARFLLVYLVSGVVGFSASLLWHPGLSVGASGAIFGAVGGLLALAAVTKDSPLGKHLARALAPFVVVTLVIGFFLPFVDNTAHVGGLVAGFLLSYGLFADAKGDKLEELRAAGVLLDDEALTLKPRFTGPALLATLSLFVLVVPLSLKPWFSPRYHAALGFAAVRAHDLEKAKAHAADAERAASDDPVVLLLRGRLWLEEAPKERERARSFFAEALSRYDEPDPGNAMMRALTDAGLFGEEEVLFGDERLAAALCEETLGEDEKGSALLLNSCAWLALKADDPQVHDVRRGLSLAKKAVARAEGLSGEARAAIWHTLAEARAQSGDPEEARVIMERILVEGWSSTTFYVEERDRFAAMGRELGARGPR